MHNQDLIDAINEKRVNFYEENDITPPNKENAMKML